MLSTCQRWFAMALFGFGFSHVPDFSGTLRHQGNMRLVFDIRGLHVRGSLGQRWIGLDIVAVLSNAFGWRRQHS